MNLNLNIYRIAQENGFDFTGEFRIPRELEYFIDTSGTAVQAQVGRLYIDKRLILKPSRYLTTIDNVLDIVGPEGYVFERIGIKRQDDTTKLFLSRSGAQFVNYATAASDAPYFIFRPV